MGEIVGLTEDAAEDFILVRFPESMPQGYPPQARIRVRVRVRVRARARARARARNMLRV